MRETKSSSEEDLKFSFQFSDNKRENEDKITEFIEILTPKVTAVFPETERQSEVLYVLIELLTNACDHVKSEIRTASMALSFTNKSVLVEYSDSGDFFSKEKVKKSLESGALIESTRENKGGVGTAILVKYASELRIDAQRQIISLLFE